MNESSQQNSISTRRETLKTKGITCPEGIWILEAIISFSDKTWGIKGWEYKKSGEIIQNFIEFLLTTPTLEVFTINSYDGSKEPIDRDYLRSRTALMHFLQGFIPFHNEFRTGNSEGEYIFVNKSQFLNVLQNKPLQEESTIPKSVDLHFLYIPPYMELMLKAVNALNLLPDRRMNKDSVIEWLDQNWPTGLEGKSDRLIESMATLMRRPEDKKGGNTPWK